MAQFGHIEDVLIGAKFLSRMELSQAKVHRPSMAGICGSAATGAESIVMSGGYEDDEDNGDEIVYTGHGGNDPATGAQIADQEFTRGNRALAVNADRGVPVRVVRGYNLKSQYAPRTGFRYDGLYHVDEYWHEIGRSGYRIYRYRLVRDGSFSTPWSPDEIEEAPTPSRVKSTVQRIVRNTKMAQQVKEIHSFACQICGEVLMTPTGPYSEGAHIKPLGKPHNGPDTIGNILCLCPNHHVLFDRGSIIIEEDLSIDSDSESHQCKYLRTKPEHQINHEYLNYRREHFG